MESLLHDIKYSVRQFRRVPLLVGAIVGTLALAIGANTLLFGIGMPRSSALATLRESRKQDLPAAARQYEIRVMSLHQRIYGDFTRPLVLLLGTVACVLLIGCANIANLLLARSESRRGELAVRIALGASTRRLFRQLLVESLLLASVGALAGVGLALGGLRAFRALGPRALATLPSLGDRRAGAALHARPHDRHRIAVWPRARGCRSPRGS